MDAILYENEQDNSTPIFHRPATAAGHSQVHGGESHENLSLQIGEVDSKGKAKKPLGGGLLGEATTSVADSVISLPVLKDVSSSTVTLTEEGSKEMELEQGDQVIIPEHVAEEHHSEEHPSLQYSES